MAKIANIGLLLMAAFDPAFQNAIADAKDRAQAHRPRAESEDAIKKPEAAVSPMPAMNPGVATIDVSGIMFKSAPWWYDGETTQDWGRQVDAAAADASIDSVFMRFDTPGGTVDGIDHFGERIAAAAKIKPVVAQVDGMCCSAGMWAAANATQIYAGPRDIVGSIGVRMMLYDFSKMFENEGVRAIPIDTGEFKSAGAMGTVITDAQIADFKRVTLQYFADFRETMMRGRSMSSEEFKAVGDGRVWLAEDGKGLKLVDGIQRPAATLSAMIATAESKRRGGRAMSSIKDRAEALRAAATPAA